MRSKSDQLVALVESEAGNAATNAIRAKNAADAVDVKTDPRWKLLERNKTAFIKALKPFAPQQIIFVSCGLTGAEKDEADKLEEDLMQFLDKRDFGKNDGAGWTVEPKPQYATSDECESATVNVPPAVGGIVLAIGLNATHEATVSAGKLEDTLNKLRIATRIIPDTRVDNEAVSATTPDSFWKLVANDPKAIFLLVGPNPSFSLTNAKKRPE